ncbi:hypothetical protein GF373_17095, partial [bacterium]|nr:hypothetical protein [bacterium]
MKTRLLFTCFIALFILVAAILGLLSWDTTTNEPSIKISYTTPEDFDPTFPETSDITTSPTPAEAKGKVAAGKRIVEPTRPPIHTAHTHQNTDRKAILIQDAMGEPIAAGRISLGTNAFPFKNGNVQLADSLAASIPVHVSAEGYFAVRETVDFSTNPTQILTMEYRCNYDIQVLANDKITPSPYTAVKIW